MRRSIRAAVLAASLLVAVGVVSSRARRVRRLVRRTTRRRRLRPSGMPQPGGPMGDPSAADQLSSSTRSWSRRHDLERAGGCGRGGLQGDRCSGGPSGGAPHRARSRRRARSRSAGARPPDPSARCSRRRSTRSSRWASSRRPEDGDRGGPDAGHARRAVRRRAIRGRFVDLDVPNCEGRGRQRRAAHAAPAHGAAPRPSRDPQRWMSSIQLPSGSATKASLGPVPSSR